MVTIVDPHIKRDDSYEVSREAKAQQMFVKNKDGSDFEGWCWPGKFFKCFCLYCFGVFY